MRIRYLGAVVLLLVSTNFVIPQANSAPDAHVVQDFQARVKHYLEWRKKAAGKAPAPADSSAKLNAERQELANKVRVARAGAKQGEIFAPPIAQYFRRQIAATLDGHYGHAIRATLRHAEPVKRELQINQSYPANVPLQSTPPTLLLNLPALPKGLEYRILGRELVLRDTDANIVVDYIPDALPASQDEKHS